MKKSKTAVFFGTEDFSAAGLKALIEGGYRLAAVITKPDSRGGRGNKPIVPAVKSIAQKAGIDVLQPAKVGEIDSDIKALKPDYAVLAAYGKIIPQTTIDLFPDGIINIHPSLLPKYRGPSPVETAILNGDKETGVSLMRLSAGMDEGPVYAAETLSLQGNEEGPNLSEKMAEMGARLLIEKLPAILEGWLTPRPQIDAEASYSKLFKKTDGVMDFGQPAEVLERQVRAFAGWPRSSAEIHGQKVIVTKARVAKDKADGALVVACKPGFLAIEELIAASGRKMSGADFIRGYSKN